MSDLLRRYSDIEMQPTTTRGAGIEEIDDGTIRLSIAAGDKGTYRLAQIDNYQGLPRVKFPHEPPVVFSLRARASSAEIPGTWGFGLWNDPFGITLSGGAGGTKLPAFPNTAWFFHASIHSHLALRDDIPANGWFAGTFRSPGWGALRLVPWLPLVPALGLAPIANFLRRKAGVVIPHDAALIPVDPTEWNLYSLQWRNESVRFFVRSELVYETRVVPKGRIGLVIWIDNQFMSYSANSSPRWGTLPSEQPAWIEFSDLSITHLAVNRPGLT